MNIETFRNYCLSKKLATESFPFDDEVLVFKVQNKMFALTNIYSTPWQVNLKCEPEKAITLRAEHLEITAGYHMNKKHWNTVDCQGDLSDDLILELIDDSYDLVVTNLPKKLRAELKNQ